MARKKVKLAFIANNSKRKTTYNKRKQSLLKKTEELSTLCGIEACAIVYGPNDPRPEIWPSESGVINVLGKFKSMPQWEQTKKMANQERFIADSIVKGKEKLKKLADENKEKEMSLFMVQWLKTGKVQPEHNMTMADFNVLSSMIDQNLKDIAKKMEMLNVNEVIPNQPQMQTPAFQPDIPTSSFEPQMQNPSYQPQMQTPAFQTLMQAPALVAYQPQMPTLTPEEMTLLNNGYGSDMNANPMQSQGFMDWLNGNGDD
ncbi:agamous-like MADS-box protein AGL80 [Glycine soja]|uniref:Agamous-like MADS-box protein AGL80 n=1 Tax=Glycine soja TaxID=3848 RepID=A0A0B2PEH8_GLYSO|nr:agamous-like MADS-box protein AGL80 [Glycine soja]KHN05997.1 Agamous-like MADS-box protein AGL80 [Glycine soja]RZB50792.1 Agamous-like MADS-box protein AGL80 [Glycine soja]